METSDFCWSDVWWVRRMRLLLICSSSLWGSWAIPVESSRPSGFQVRNWKRTERPPMADGVAGSDRKLLLELRKVVATSWGSEQEKDMLPWRQREHSHLALIKIKFQHIRVN